MKETKEKVKKLEEMKEKLVCCMETELAKGIESVSTEEAGQVVDMIKDLADAEKNCWEACYYKKIVEAMGEEKEEMELMEKMGYSGSSRGSSGGMGGRSGYDNWRYSSGRFAPSGRGHYAGYIPMTPYMDRLGYPDDMGMMGYSSGGNSGGSYGGGRGRSSGGNSGYGSSGGNSGSSQGGNSSGGNSGGNSGRSGYSNNMMRPYDQWEDARRHYHESGRQEDKQKMDQHAQEHVMETVETMKMIWDDADPQMKARMKTEMEELMRKMK